MADEREIEAAEPRRDDRIMKILQRLYSAGFRSGRANALNEEQGDDGPDPGGAYEELHTALAAAEQARWRPIETAPKDGTKFIVGAWLDHGECGREWVETCVFGTPETFLREGGGYLDWYPTHWMPLPAPPEENG